MNIKSKLSNILVVSVLLISSNTNCFLPKLSVIANLAQQRTKKLIEKITFKDVAMYTAGTVAIGLGIILVKQSKCIAKLGDDLRKTNGKLESMTIFTERLKTLVAEKLGDYDKNIK